VPVFTGAVAHLSYEGAVEGTHAGVAHGASNLSDEEIRVRQQLRRLRRSHTAEVTWNGHSIMRMEGPAQLVGTHSRVPGKTFQFAGILKLQVQHVSDLLGCVTMACLKIRHS
jgi:hypothetical protein